MNEAAEMKAMLRWLLLSFVLHALVLLIFADFMPSTVTSSPPAALQAIEAMLQEKQQTQTPKSVAMASEIKPNHSVLKVPIPVPNVIRPGAEKPVPAAAESAASVPAAGSTTATVGGDQPIGESRVKQVDVLSQDGLREYRLNLSREARRYKRYPALARQRGLEGVVVIVVSTSAGLAVPQVSLSRSSGQEVLDQQALEMLILAVRAASLPDALLGRDFAIDLPIHFSLDE